MNNFQFCIKYKGILRIEMTALTRVLFFLIGLNAVFIAQARAKTQPNANAKVRSEETPIFFQHSINMLNCHNERKMP